jgi:hypothetical protein
MAHRLRKVDLALALFGFVVAFGVTLTAIIVVRYEASGHAAANPPGSVRVQAGTDGHLTPAVLDRQWVTYSNRSTCPDRSGGDGVAAVRLSSSQIAWFFSDSSLGPAGPRIGFSEQSGFVHDLVVMQTIREELRQPPRIRRCPTTAGSSATPKTTSRRRTSRRRVETRRRGARLSRRPGPPSRCRAR